MQAKLSSHSASDIYHLMTQTVVPRPIAWILTENEIREPEGRGYNLAPFSFFNAMASSPPTLIVSIGKKASGDEKDTRANLKKGQHNVLHIPSVEQAALVSDTSRTLEYGDSELSGLPLQLTEFGDFPIPRIKECKIAFGCKAADIIEWGSTQQALILLEIEHIYIDDSIIGSDSNGRLKVDAKTLDPLSRLGANEYASLGEIIGIARPS